MKGTTVDDGPAAEPEMLPLGTGTVPLGPALVVPLPAGNGATGAGVAPTGEFPVVLDAPASVLPWAVWLGFRGMGTRVWVITAGAEDDVPALPGELAPGAGLPAGLFARVAVICLVDVSSVVLRPGAAGP